MFSTVTLVKKFFIKTFLMQVRNIKDPDICVGLFTIWKWSVKIFKSLLGETFKLKDHN